MFSTFRVDSYEFYYVSIYSVAICPPPRKVHVTSSKPEEKNNVIGLIPDIAAITLAEQKTLQTTTNKPKKPLLSLSNATEFAMQGANFSPKVTQNAFLFGDEFINKNMNDTSTQKTNNKSAIVNENSDTDTSNDSTLEIFKSLKRDSTGLYVLSPPSVFDSAAYR